MHELYEAVLQAKYVQAKLEMQRAEADVLTTTIQEKLAGADISG